MREFVCVRVMAICMVWSNHIITIMNKPIEDCKSWTECGRTSYWQKPCERRFAKEEDKFD